MFNLLYFQTLNDAGDFATCYNIIIGVANKVSLKWDFEFYGKLSFLFVVYYSRLFFKHFFFLCMIMVFRNHCKKNLEYFYFSYHFLFKISTYFLNEEHYRVVIFIVQNYDNFFSDRKYGIKRARCCLLLERILK